MFPHMWLVSDGYLKDGKLEKIKMNERSGDNKSSLSFHKTTKNRFFATITCTLPLRKLGIYLRTCIRKRKGLSLLNIWDRSKVNLAFKCEERGEVIA